MKDGPSWLVVQYIRDGDGWRTEVDNGPETTPVIGAPVESYEGARRLADRQGFRLRFDQRVWDAMAEAGRAPTDSAPPDVTFFIGSSTTDQERLHHAFAAAAERFDADSPAAASSARAVARYAWRIPDDVASRCLHALDAGTNLLWQPFEFEGSAPEQIIEKLLVR